MLTALSLCLLSFGSHLFLMGLSINKVILQIGLDDDHVRMYRDAFTYINIVKTPLQPVLIDGSIAKVTRGWEQMLLLEPEKLSLDPDYPLDKVKKFTDGLSKESNLCNLQQFFFSLATEFQLHLVLPGGGSTHPRGAVGR